MIMIVAAAAAAAAALNQTPLTLNSFSILGAHIRF